MEPCTFNAMNDWRVAAWKCELGLGATTFAEDGEGTLVVTVGDVDVPVLIRRLLALHAAETRQGGPEAGMTSDLGAAAMDLATGIAHELYRRESGIPEDDQVADDYVMLQVSDYITTHAAEDRDGAHFRRLMEHARGVRLARRRPPG